MAPVLAASLSPSDDGQLRAEMAALGTRPFVQQVVKSVWNTVVDVEPLHAAVKARILELIDGCGTLDAIRCLTVLAPHGYGKTHLLAWVRQSLEDCADILFVPIAPWTPTSPDSESLEKHILRSAVDAIWLRTRRQQEQFKREVLGFLVSCCDRLPAALGSIFRADSWWSRFFTRERLGIAAQGVEDQLAALQRGFDHRAFLLHAFSEFEQANPPMADGARPDRDAFVATCLRCCGTHEQKEVAISWFGGVHFRPNALAPFHLDSPCEGTEKVRNALFTLNRLAGQTFCLAFDQMEDTYNALQGVPETGTKLGQKMAGLLRNLSTIPRFCQLFMFQQSVWQNFAQFADPMLVDRMTEGYRAQMLEPLNEPLAYELVRARLDHFVWSELGPVRRPVDRPFFPLTQDSIRSVLRLSAGELRPFLQLIQAHYDDFLGGSASPQSRPRIELTHIDPREVVSNERIPVQITGRHIPEKIDVWFGHAAAEQIVRHPDGNRIDATTPCGLSGEVSVRVCDTDDPNNFATLRLLFSDELPRPYYAHIDLGLLRNARTEARLHAITVVIQIRKRCPGTKINDKTIYALENGTGEVSDEVLKTMAELYKRPLSSFRKVSGKKSGKEP